MKTMQVASTVLLTLAANASSAQQPANELGKCYELQARVYGDGEPNRSAMCAMLEANLNEFCAEAPMVCTLRIAPNHPEFSLPAWQPLDVAANRALLERLVRGKALGTQSAQIRQRNA